MPHLWGAFRGYGRRVGHFGVLSLEAMKRATNKTLKIFGWQLGFRRSGKVESSPFASLLPRVRTMRDECRWPSSTMPASQEAPRFYKQKRSDEWAGGLFVSP